MRAAQSSKGFFPPGAETPGSSTSKARPIEIGASFIPDIPPPRPRKLSNKLLKKRPPLRSGSTPPSSFRGNAQGKDDAFIEAVVSTVEMIAPRPKKKSSKDNRPLAERSFFSPAEPWEERSGGVLGPTLSQNSDPTTSTDSSGSTSSLKKAPGFAQPGPRYQSPATPPDLFRRGPPVIITGPSPSPTSGIRPGEIFGSATTRYPADDTSITKWTPRENRGTVIALYKPPEMGPNDSPQPRPDVDVTSEEKDDTIIALYKPPPQARQQSASPQLSYSRNAQRQRSNTLAGVPGSPNVPEIDTRASSSRPQGVTPPPMNNFGPPASNAPVLSLNPSSRTRSNTVGSRPNGDRQQSPPPLNLNRSYSCELATCHILSPKNTALTKTNGIELQLILPQQRVHHVRSVQR